MKELDWNRERYRTRDLLLEYDYSIMPVRPRTAGLAMVYPWESTNLRILNHQFYQMAVINGYAGTEDEFKRIFNNYVSKYNVIFAKYNEFPRYGDKDKLYFDTEEKALYYWDNEYLLVNAMIVANTILEGGGA